MSNNDFNRRTNVEPQDRYANSVAQMKVSDSIGGSAPAQNTRSPRPITEVLDAALKRLTGLETVAQDLSSRIGGPPAELGAIMRGIGAEQVMPADLHSMATEIERILMTVESRLVNSLNRL